MPVPRPAQVTELVTPVLTGAGAELDGVTVTAAGRRSVVRIVVDSEDGLDMDAVAALTRAVSQVLDAEESLSAYTLEVTTPGTSRPLTLPRHWRRNRGRSAEVTVRTPDGLETFTARIGEVSDGVVVLVVPAARRSETPALRSVALSDVDHAVVAVEFSPPDPAEIALSGAPRAVSPSDAPAEASSNDSEDPEGPEDPEDPDQEDAP